MKIIMTKFQINFAKSQEGGSVSPKRAVKNVSRDLKKKLKSENKEGFS